MVMRGIRLCCFAIGLCAPSGMTAAHEWYPPDCCHGQDCAAVTSLRRLPDGGFRVETTHGFGVIPRGFLTRPSLDDKAHACLRQIGPDEEHLGWLVVCLFLPGNA